MRRAAHGLGPLPAVLAGVLFAGVTGGVAVSLLATLPAAAAWPARRRLALPVPAQVLVVLACGMLAVVLAAFLPSRPEWGSEALRPAWAQLGLTALLVAGTRLHVAAPAGGLAATYGSGLLVFMACGTVRSGSAYPALLTAYALLAFAALGARSVADGAQPPPARAARRRWLAATLLLVVSAGLATGLVVALPRFYLAAYDWALRWVDERRSAGFHDGAIRLGALEGLLDSGEVVMRVEGDPGDRLRGNVYGHYARGRWLPALDRLPRPVSRPGQRLASAEDVLAAGGETVRADVRMARGDLDRFFVPAAAGRIATTPAPAHQDALGVVRTPGDEKARRLLLLAADAPALPAAGPLDGDRALPEELAPELFALASAWTRDAASEAERVAALVARLEAEYAYSLTGSGASDGRAGEAAERDPVLAFLLDHRAGHCEYFASALTLLARAEGIPARLVTGYRVAERNPLGDYAIVRERHAHAWSEVWLDGAWQTVDPSPLRGPESGARATPLVAAAADWLIVQWQQRGIELLLVALVGGLAAAQIVRLVRGRLPAEASAEDVDEAPPRWLEALLGRLSERGLARPPSQPLEVLARRVQAAEVLDAELPAGASGDAVAAAARAASLGEAATLLRRYAALRYGGEGDPDRLRRDVEGWLARTGS